MFLEKKCKNCKDGEMCKRVEYFVNTFAYTEYKCIPIPLEQSKFVTMFGLLKQLFFFH